MLLKEAIADYLLYLQHEQGASVNTIRSYRSSLYHFQRWVEAQALPSSTIMDTIVPLAGHYSYAPGEQGRRPRSRLRLRFPLR